MEKSNDIIERSYWAIKRLSSQSRPVLRLVFIRLRKFIALPYCYFRYVNWDECPHSYFRVLKDFLYIFFKLKYYPENYGYCRLWEKDRDTWKYYYGSNYDAYQSYKLGKEVQRREYDIVFRDKEICNQMCIGAGIKAPEIHAVLDPREDYRSKLSEIGLTHKKLILKPSIGHGGQGVMLLVNKNGSIQLAGGGKRIDLADLVLGERYLVQEFIEQDERLSALTSSVSIRISTLYTRSGEVIPLQSDMVTAVDNNIVSNWSAGGVSIGIDLESGRLADIGYDKQGKIYYEHPTSRIKFSEYVVPEWEELIEYAIKIQKAFPFFRILGPDMTLTPDGPMIYEINATPDLAGGEQSNGPLLANKQVLDAFRQYDLLINDALDEVQPIGTNMN